MRLRNTWVGLLGLALATTLACGGGSSETKPADTAAAPAAGGGGSKVDPATAGDVKGVVAFGSQLSAVSLIEEGRKPIADS